MRTIYKYFLLLSLLVTSLAVTSCKDDAPLSSVAECSWVFSADQSGTTLYLSKGKYISFMDLSLGQLSHRWEVSEDGTLFLDGKMEWGQSTYDNLINYDIPHINDRTTIHVYFTEAGTHTVRLYNTFAEQVYYPYAEWNSTLGEFDHFVKEAVLEDGIYVFDQTLTIEVYDGVLAPSAEVYYDKECTKPVDMGIITPAVYAVDGKTILTPATYKEVEIEYGDTLYFKDTSYDRPNTWTWTCAAMGNYTNSYAGYESQGSVIPVTFQQLTYAPVVDIDEDPFVMKLQIERATPESLSESKDIPTATQVTANIPLNIKVVPTTQPLAYSVQQTSQTTLELTLANSEFLEDAVFDASKYVVGWSNDYEGAAHIDGTITPTSVAVTDDLKVIEITLPADKMIYNTDDITFYMKDGAKETAVLFDGGDFAISKPAEVITTYCPMIWDEDFESGNAEADGWKAMLPTSGEFTEMVDAEKNGVMIDSTNSFAENLNEDAEAYPDGNYTKNEGHSLRVDAQLYDNTAPLFSNQCITLVSPAFTNPLVTVMTLTFDMYIPESAEAKDGFSPTFNTVSSAQSQGSTNTWCTMRNTGTAAFGAGGWLSIASYTYKGQWITYSFDIKPKDMETVYEDLRLTMRLNGYKGVVYFDNITLGSIEIRPRE